MKFWSRNNIFRGYTDDAGFADQEAVFWSSVSAASAGSAHLRTMLPPGHVAAGFLTAKALLQLAKPDLPINQINTLVYWGMFFSFAPDLDNFIAYAKIRAWWYKPGVDSSIHRKFYSHIPVLWLIPGLLIYFLAADVYFKYIGLMLIVGSWSHFILDSIDGGVMWLWPCSKEVWALRNRGVNRGITADGFFDYWWQMVKMYTATWTFCAEVLILLTTLLFISTKY